MKFKILLSRLLFAGGAAGLVAPSALAVGFSIVPTFGTSISSLGNAASIEATINAAIGIYQTTFKDPITVHITFENMGSGLGQSEFNLYDIPYSNFVAAATFDKTSPDDTTAVAGMTACPVPVNPATCTNPVTGTTDVLIKSANAAALGINLGLPFANVDGTISLNTSITNISRSGAQNPNFYDLQAVTMHEIDEILGLGSTLGLNFTGAASGLNNDPSPEDFFRFDAAGNRSFSTLPTAAFFSINAVTDLAQFNSSGSGDYGDWSSSATPMIQDAFGTPGAQPNIGVEVRALDVIGYNRVSFASPVPEPGTWLLLASGLCACRYQRRSRKQA